MRRGFICVLLLPMLFLLGCGGKNRVSLDENEKPLWQKNDEVSQEITTNEEKGEEEQETTSKTGNSFPYDKNYGIYDSTIAVDDNFTYCIQDKKIVAVSKTNPSKTAVIYSFFDAEGTEVSDARGTRYFYDDRYIYRKEADKREMLCLKEIDEYHRSAEAKISYKKDCSNLICVGKYLFFIESTSVTYDAVDDFGENVSLSALVREAIVLNLDTYESKVISSELRVGNLYASEESVVFVEYVDKYNEDEDRYYTSYLWYSYNPSTLDKKLLYQKDDYTEDTNVTMPDEIRLIELFSECDECNLQNENRYFYYDKVHHFRTENYICHVKLTNYEPYYIDYENSYGLDMRLPMVLSETDFLQLSDSMTEEDTEILKMYYKKYDIDNLSKKDEENKEEILSKYPELKNQALFVLRKETKEKVKRCIADIFDSIGFDKNTCEYCRMYNYFDYNNASEEISIKAPIEIDYYNPDTMEKICHKELMLGIGYIFSPYKDGLIVETIGERGCYCTYLSYDSIINWTNEEESLIDLFEEEDFNTNINDRKAWIRGNRMYYTDSYYAGKELNEIDLKNVD